MEPAAAAVTPVKLPLKQRLSALFAEYGSVAIYTYLTLSLLTIAAFSVAIGFGVEPSSASGVLGVIGAGWLAAKATMPIRIPIAIALTPWIAGIVRRRRKARGEDEVVPADGDDDDDDDDDDDE
jgi:hypothetical protein